MKSLLKQLLPPVSYSLDAPRLDSELDAEAKRFDLTLESADRARNGVTPYFAESLLPDWERVLDLTPDAKLSYQQRLELVLVKLAETGGLSIPYFVQHAKKLGYDITIDELDPFQAGVSRAGDRLTHPGILWVWVVNIFGSKAQFYRFRAGGSIAGERLSFWADSVIETVFNDLKPAHTFCYFTYQES
ncbi:YmfQ family protein [Providencia rettgeri]